MLAKFLKRACMLAILLSFGTAFPIYSQDIEGRHDVTLDMFKAGFIVKNESMTLVHNFIEFQYLDWASGGKQDVFKDIEFYLYLKNSSTPILLATMPRCHDEMVVYNQEYGALHVHKSSADTDPRTVYMHFYPGTKAIGQMAYLQIRGWWDRDGNNTSREEDGTGDFSVSEMRDLSKCNTIFMGEKLNMSFERLTPNGISFDAKTTIIPDNGFTQYIGVNDTENYVTKYGLFSMEHGSHTSGNLTGTFDPSKQEKLFAYTYVERKQEVMNNSYGDSHRYERYDIHQRFYSAISTHEVSCYPKPAVLMTTLDSKSLLNTLNWAYSNSQAAYSTKDPVQIYRRKSTEPADARVKLGEVTVESKTFKESTPVDDPFASYIYEVIVSPAHWNPMSTVLSAQKTVGPIVTWKGEGTVLSPYLIETADDLRLLSSYVNAGYETLDKHWKVTANIDLGGDASPWFPIGTAEHAFHGGFNGDGFEISGLNLGDVNGKGVGLFGYVYGSVLPYPMLRNIYVKDGTLTGLGEAGLIVGNLQKGTMRNCYATGTVECSGDNVGGLAGYSTSLTAENCAFVGTVTGNGVVGGLVGFQNGTVSKSYVSATVAGKTTAGAMFGTGDVAADHFTHCYYDQTLAGSQKGFGSKGLSENVDGKNVIGLPDLKGTALVGQFGIVQWNFTAGQLPALKTVDKANEYDVTLKEGVTLNDISAEVDNVSVLCKVVGKNKYTTLMLPFALTKNEIANVGKFYHYCGFYSGEGRNIAFFQEVYGTEANKAYLFERITAKPVRDNTLLNGYSFNVQGATLIPAGDLAEPVQDDLYGSYKLADIPSSGYFYVNEKEAITEFECGEFQKPNGEQVTPMNAYWFKTGIPADVTNIEIMLFDATSSVPTVLEDLKNADGRIYNLKGQLLEEPEDGVNIMNGVKVLKWHR